MFIPFTCVKSFSSWAHHPSPKKRKNFFPQPTCAFN